MNPNFPQDATGQLDHLETEGRADGEAAARSNGGTRGAEWRADCRGLTGEARQVYVDAFNAALDEGT